MNNKLLITLCASIMLAAPSYAAPAGSAFTYQGRLGDAGQPANGSYDLQFALRDAQTGGATNGGPVVMEDVNVQHGLFTVTLDFGGDAFSEGARWLEIGVRPGAETAAFTLLSPRQAITAAPLALHALQADTAAQAVSALSAANAVNATKADSADAVAWNHVSGLPAGFADGTDNDSTYSAGAGLTLGAGNQFALNFAGSGALNTAARSDHSHFGALWSGATPGTALSLTNTAADGLSHLLRQGTGTGLIPPPAGITAALWADAHDGPAILATSLNQDGAIVGQNHSTSVASTGVTGQSLSSTGRGLYGHATSTASGLAQAAFGVVGETESPGGAGVKAVGASTSGAALELQNGGIKVSGAGVNSPTPVFVHEATVANLGGASGSHMDWHTTINHPLCNNRPNAILILTPRYASTGSSHGTLVAEYNETTARWRINVQADYTADWDDYYGIDPGAQFNVLVVNP